MTSVPIFNPQNNPNVVEGNLLVTGNETIEGNLQVDGSITATAITAGVFTPASINTGAIVATSINDTGPLTVGGLSTMNGAVQAEGVVSTFNGTPGVILGQVGSVGMILGTGGGGSGVLSPLKLASTTLTSTNASGTVRTTLDNGAGAMTVGGGITSTAAANNFGASTIGSITNSSANTFGGSTFSSPIVVDTTSTTSVSMINALAASFITNQQASIRVGVDNTTNGDNATLAFTYQSAGAATNALSLGFNGGVGNILTMTVAGKVSTNNVVIDDGSGDMLANGTMKIGGVSGTTLTSGGNVAITGPATSGTLALTDIFCYGTTGASLANFTITAQSGGFSVAGGNTEIQFPTITPAVTYLITFAVNGSITGSSVASVFLAVNAPGTIVGGGSTTAYEFRVINANVTATTATVTGSGIVQIPGSSTTQFSLGLGVTNFTASTVGYYCIRQLQ